VVDGVLAGREPSEPGVFGDSDPVFDPGVGAVAGFQESDLPGSRVGDERLVAPPITLFEEAELGAGVGVFAADDDPHPGRPGLPQGVGQQAGDLHDVGVFADIAVGVDRGCPRLLRHQRDRVPDRLGDRKPHAVLHRPAPSAVLGGSVQAGEPVQQAVRGAGPVSADQHLSPVRGGDLVDGPGEHVEVIGGRVGPGVTRP
jgi:hypothetical protein